MALRGFKNDNESVVPSVHNGNKRTVIGKVMASGGTVRQVLRGAGIEVETTGWQGLPGEQVARRLLEQVMPLVLGLSPGQRERVVYLEKQYEIITGEGVFTNDLSAAIVPFSGTEGVCDLPQKIGCPDGKIAGMIP